MEYTLYTSLQMATLLIGAQGCGHGEKEDNDNDNDNDDNDDDHADCK